jgi:protein disulfide-isomerase-like protein
MFALQLCLTFVLFAAVAASDVVILDSKNFEHLTQASSGATTGDWLIKFYAPWCGHCKTLAPIYEEVAKQLKGEVNVAKVDVTESRDLGNRFEIKGFPTVKFLSKGNVYTFKGRRSTEELVEFARGGYQIHQPEVVRGPMGMFGEIFYVYEHAYKQAGKDLKSGKYFTIDVFLTFLPVIFGIIMLLLIMMPNPTPSKQHRDLTEETDEDSEHEHAAAARQNATAPTSRTDSASRSHGKAE